MRFQRLFGTGGLFLSLALSSLGLASGCGGADTTPGVIQETPEQVKTRQEGIQNAMKGGNYGGAAKAPKAK